MNTEAAARVWVRVEHEGDGGVVLTLSPSSRAEGIGCAILLMGILLGTGLSFVLPGVVGLAVMGGFMVCLYLGTVAFQRWGAAQVSGKVRLAPDRRRLERVGGAAGLEWSELALPERGLLVLERLRSRSASASGHGTSWTQLGIVPVEADAEDAALRATFEGLRDPAKARAVARSAAQRPELCEGVIKVTRGAARELGWALARALRWPVADFDREGATLALPGELDETIAERFEGLGTAEGVDKPWSVGVRQSEGRLTLAFPSYSLGMRIGASIGFLFMAGVFYLFSDGHVGPPAGAVLLGLLVVTNRASVTCEPEGLTLGGSALGLHATRPTRVPWQELRAVTPISEGFAGLRFDLADGPRRQLLLPGKRAGSYVMGRIGDYLRDASKASRDGSPYR